MSDSGMTPTKLRLILSASMILTVAIGVILFMVGYKKISDYSVSSQAVAAQAQASDSSLNELMAVKKELAADADVVQRASQIVSESRSYLYQDQIIKDINRFAADSGIVVTNITFGSGGQDTTSRTTAAPSTSSTPSAAGAAPSGIKTTNASVTVKNPVDYTKMLTFIHSIENSLFKMRISQVSLSKSADTKGSNNVTSDVLNIEVYIR